jgi:oxygen-independent coproporphyrinogen-3 oxidase
VFPAPGVVELPYGLYPGPSSFSDSCTEKDYLSWVDHSNGDPLPAPIAVYIQDSASPGGLTEPGNTSARRLDVIERELRILGELYDSDRPVKQLICAGSIASQWSDDELYRLVDAVQASLLITASGLLNWCACLGPLMPSTARLRLLRVLGFSNIRFALFDHSDDPAVLDQFKATIDKARTIGMELIALDVVHDQARGQGLSQDMGRLLDDTRPDRVRLVAFAGDRYTETADMLEALGYHAIGQDWFVRADDRWMRAKDENRLHWCMLGFTEMSSPDVIGVGPGALSSVGDFYAQNTPDWSIYRARLMQGHLPIVRGMELEPEDVLRREIIASVLAASRIRLAAVENKWGIRFAEFFARELDQMRGFEQQNRVTRSDDEIRINTRRYQELTEICSVFDRQPGVKPAYPVLSLV